MTTRQRVYLLVIVIAQFCCTSLWFASNGVLEDLIANFNLNDKAVGSLTSAVQLGFIAGTILFAIISLVDRYSPSKIFLTCAVLGSGINVAILWEENTLSSLLLIRFVTGFFLAGIYPVGMKIASDHFEKGLGKSLGFLVGALVVGTAFPHLLKAFPSVISWRSAIVVTSSIALAGGIMMFLIVPDGPFRRSIAKIKFDAIFEIFEDKRFRAASFGYFGHMWELYTFWVFVPIILNAYAILYNEPLNVSFWSFIIIASGGLACVIAGILAEKIGSKQVAMIALFFSGICCLIAPLVFQYGAKSQFIAFLVFWGMVVVADSPLISTLVANYSQAKLRGTALTIVTGLGFAITIFSIMLLTNLSSRFEVIYLLPILAIGPVIGFMSLWYRRRRRSTLSI